MSSAKFSVLEESDRSHPHHHSHHHMHQTAASSSSSQMPVVELVGRAEDWAEEALAQTTIVEEEGTSMFISGETEMDDHMLTAAKDDLGYQQSHVKDVENTGDAGDADDDDSDGDADDEEFSDDDEDVKASPAVVKALSERHHLEFLVIVSGGIALAFNAGFVNGCTYLIGNTPVSHITGTTTKAGLFLGQHDFQHFAINLALITSYIFGAGITGAMMPNDSFQLGREYGPLFIIGSALFLLACLATYYAPDTNLFFYFAAMACGLQNGMTTKYSGSIIRTTHMTGAGTDIGLVLGRIAIGDTKERWKLLVLIPLLSSFLIGGMVSVYVHRHLGTLSLLVNVVVFLSVGIAYSVVIGREMHIPFWRAMFGFYVTVEKKVIDSHGHVKRVADKTRQAMKTVVAKVKSPLMRRHHHSKKDGSGKRSRKGSSKKVAKQ